MPARATRHWILSGCCNRAGRTSSARCWQLTEGELGANFWARLNFYTKIIPLYEILFGLETS